MNLTVEQNVDIKEMIDSYRNRYLLSNDHIECSILTAKIDILEFLLEVLNK